VVFNTAVTYRFTFQ